MDFRSILYRVVFRVFVVVWVNSCILRFETGFRILHSQRACMLLVHVVC